MPSLLCDLHNHTVDDPRDKHVWHTAEELIDRAAALGYGVLAITLHGLQRPLGHLSEYAAEKGILLLPGVEQDIEGCHVLLLNFDRDAANGIRTFQDLQRERRKENLVIAAHPFFPGEICLRERVFEHAELFDALEITSFYHPLWNPNAKAQEAALKLNLPTVGNSDTHALNQFGTTCSLVEVAGEVTALSVLEGIKARRVQVKTRALNAWQIGRIGYQVVGRGYMPWINYPRQRGRNP